MFFRREKPRKFSFADRLDALRQAGFQVSELQSGRASVARQGFAAVIEDRQDDPPRIIDPGMVVGNEIGLLTHGGYQMFFVTPLGRKEPALAEQLRALHDFREDLTEILGRESYYNTALGTVCSHHLYDRVEDRDDGVPVRAWEHS